MHTYRRLGWRWADLVCGGPACSPFGYCCSRNGRDVQAGPPLPKCRCARGAGSSRPTGRHANRHATHRTRKGDGSYYALPIGWRRRGQSHCGVLQFAKVGRHILRHGPRRICRALETVLARPSLRMTDMGWEAAVKGFTHFTLSGTNLTADQSVGQTFSGTFDFRVESVRANIARSGGESCSKRRIERLLRSSLRAC